MLKYNENEVYIIIILNIYEKILNNLMIIINFVFSLISYYINS